MQTCRGRIENTTSNSAGEILHYNDSSHFVAEDSWPSDLSNSDLVKLSFSNGTEYGGDKCFNFESASEDMTIENMKGILEDDNSEILLNPPAPLFVAYVSLDSDEVRSSVARWRETLDFINSVYSEGYARQSWSDGIIITRAKSSEAKLLHIPLGNFGEELASKTHIISVSYTHLTLPTIYSV